MAKALIFVAFLFLTITTKAQKDNKYQNIDKVMLRIPDSSTYTSHDIANYINLKFANQKGKARAAFFWVTENIVYDYSDRYNLNKKSQATTTRTLALRKGICQDYTYLLKEILDNTGIKTYVVEGYTRKGKVISYNPHAWCVSMIDSTWYFTDPTFGAGIIQDDQFVKKRDYKFFMRSPEKFITNHIPFDPLWQFLEYPITKKDFVKGRIKPLNKNVYFNFRDTLKAYEKQNELGQIKSTYNRIKENGVESYIDYDILVHYQQAIDHFLKRNAEKEFSIALDYYNLGITFFNEYFDYRNNYFRPYKSDDAIRQMLDLIKEKFELSKNQLDSIVGPDYILTLYIENQKKLVNKNLVEVNNRKENLDKYLKIAKQYREKLSMQKSSNSD